MMIRNIIDRMSNELVDAADSYLDYQDDIHVNDDFYKGNEYSGKIPFDYDRFDELNPNPSTRDQEYLKHSTLVSNQQLNDNSDSSHKIELAGHKGIKEEKNKNPLPAYCTPPNPCPIGYTSKLLFFFYSSFFSVCIFIKLYIGTWNIIIICFI